MTLRLFVCLSAAATAEIRILEGMCIDDVGRKLPRNSIKRLHNFVTKKTRDSALISRFQTRLP